MSGRPPEVPAAFALDWAKALTVTTYVPMPWAEVVAFLHRQAGRLVEALHAEQFDPRVGAQIVAELVAADFTAPEAVGRTLTVWHTRLLADPDAERRNRLVALSEALTIGHSRAMRDLSLDGQESVRVALTRARDEALRQLHEAHNRERHAALHDRLTGLPNRSLLTLRLDQLLGSPKPAGVRLALCMVGLDGFSKICDSLGPDVGDRLLAAVADRLHGQAIEAGHLLARVDGDTFAILVEGTTCADDAIKAADRALRLFAEPYNVDGHELPMQASVGIVEQPAAGVTPTELMRAAGISLRWAKAHHRRRWALFDDRRNHGQVALHRLSSAMPAALARDEFSLAYQPLVELATGRLVGVEALARWDHPEQGAIPPAQFIALAEDTGLIIPLGLRLLDRACRQAQAWRRVTAGAPYVSVNISARQIHHVGLVADVAAVLDRTGLPPERLHLEITEGTAFAADEDTLATLRALAGLGITLAIDDFGTGYANHAILPMLPVRTLKIANTFVQRVDDTGAGARHRAVLANLVALGRALGLRIIAEGIETPEQADYLTAIGCDIGQGWHFGHPVPPAHIPTLASRSVG